MTNLRLHLLAIALGGATIAACMDAGDAADTAATPDDLSIIRLPPPPPPPGWATGLPADAILGGTDDDGANLYVCRGAWGGGWHPGKLRADRAYCDIGYGGGEYAATTYQTMVPSWIGGGGNLATTSAPAIGHDAANNPLYACRASYNGSVVPGRIGAGDSGCHLGWGNQEIVATTYQILAPSSVPMQARTSAPGLMQADAIVGGYEADGTPLYLCLGLWNGGMHPGKMQRSWGACDIGAAGTEQWATTYQVLVPMFDTVSPYRTTAVTYPTGNESTGAALGTCRAHYQLSSNWQVGKITAWGACNFGYAGREVSVSSDYQALAPVPTSVVLGVTDPLISTTPFQVDMTTAQAHGEIFNIEYDGPQQGQLVYQLSTLPFVGDPTDYAGAAGLVAQGTKVWQLPAMNWQLTYDFTQLVTLAQYRAAWIAATNAGQTPPPPPMGYLPSNDPADLYLRAVLVDPSGLGLAASPTLHISYGHIWHPTLNTTGWRPQLGGIWMKPVGAPDENWQYWVRCTQQLTGLAASICPYVGYEFYAPPKSSSWYDDLASFVGEAIDFIKGAWNWVVKAYETVKNAIVDAVATMIDCDSACKSVLHAALDAALAAAGMPPTLPDFDQLMHDNVTYLVDEVADQAGVPRDVAEALVQKTADAMTAARGGSGGSGFLAPAVDKQYRSGVLNVRLSAPVGTATSSGTLTVTDLSGRWAPATVAYPPLAAGTALAVPVVLVPTTPPDAYQRRFEDCMRGSGLGQLSICVSARDSDYGNWVSQYTTGTASFHIVLNTSTFNATNGVSFDMGYYNVDVSSSSWIWIGK